MNEISFSVSFEWSESSEGLGQYVQRQYRAVSNEVVKRRASLRVQALLFNDEAALKQIQQSEAEQSAQRLLSTK